MKWKFFGLMAGLTLLLTIINIMVFQIPLLIIFTPLILGSIVISVSSMMQVGVVIIVWILFYILVLGKDLI